MKKLITVLALLGLAACATSEQKKTEAKVDQAIQAEKPANQPGDIAARGEDAFMKAPGLTEAQRMKLMEIHSKAYAESTTIRTELGKTKSALFKTLIDPKSGNKEINILKKKIVALDKKRLDTMFKALDEAKKILGKNDQAENVYKEFYHLEMMNKAEHGEY